MVNLPSLVVHLRTKARRELVVTVVREYNLRPVESLLVGVFVGTLVLPIIQTCIYHRLAHGQIIVLGTLGYVGTLTLFEGKSIGTNRMRPWLVLLSEYR